MGNLAALLVLVLGAGGARAPQSLRESAVLMVVGRGAPAPLATPLPPDEAAPPPPCSADVCQPQVALPGYTSRFTAKAARTRVTLQALDAAHLEPVATVAWWIAGTGLRFDYTSRAMDVAANGGSVGQARYQLVLGWRIDAFGGPEFPHRER